MNINQSPSSNQPYRFIHSSLAEIAHAARALGALALLALAAGCATNGKVAKTDYFFFPPPPDEPRLQFLTAFASEKTFYGGEEHTLMSYLTGAKPPEKDLVKPYGAAVGNKKIYVCDTQLGAVVAADLPTRHFGVIEAQGEGALKMPMNLTVDKNGDCYVADAERDQVIVYDKNGNYLSTIGKQGEMKPRDVAVTTDRIYIADLMKHEIRVLDKTTRNLLFEIPSAEERTNKLHAIFTPTNLALDSKGNIYVSDSGAFRIQVYDANGKFVRAVGEMGNSPGQFARVKGIAIDRQNRLYAVDAMSQVVQIFDEQGKLLTWFGEPGTSTLIQNLPAKVVVDYDDVGFFKKYASPKFEIEYLVIVINQIGPDKVAVYGFGHKK